MCSELHLRPHSSPHDVLLTLVLSVFYPECPYWLAGCSSGSACVTEEEDGAPFDHPIREYRTHGTAPGRSGCHQEEWLAANPDRAVSDLLRSDDHADRGTGPNHRISTRPDSRTLPRQQRAVGGEDESNRAARSGGSGAKTVIPSSFLAGSVDPGTRNAGPVFPGRYAGSCSEWSGKNEAVSYAVQAGI
jgi:hypothetical protein